MRDKMITALFTVFISVIFVLFFVLPKHDFSVNEKRSLAEPPEFGAADIFNGSYEKKTEDYLTDHFPFRSGFVAANSYFQLASGRNGVSGVYKGRNGYLINTPVKTPNFDKNIALISRFLRKSHIPAAVIIVPTAGSVMDDMLPKNHAPYPDRALIADAYSILGGDARTIDLFGVFDKLKKSEQLYYKTDHHWTSLGAYEAYKELDPNTEEKSDFTIESYGGFRGTTYSKSALWLEGCDNIDLWTYPADITVTISDGADKKTSADMFFREHLKEADKYPVFLNGNHAYTRIENKSAGGGRRLLMIKDSYGNSLAPFLARSRNIVDMVDLRYFTDTVTSLCERENYDEILFVYGLSTAAETTDINMLE